MSDANVDPKLQTSAPGEQPGGQHPLSPDQEIYSRCANTQSQVFPLSGRSGQNVEGRNASLCSPRPNDRPLETVSGMAVGAPVGPVVKHVDQKNVGQGGYPGDTRKQAAPAQLPNQPAVRSAVHQTKISGKTDNGA